MRVAMWSRWWWTSGGTSGIDRTSGAAGTAGAAETAGTGGARGARTAASGALAVLLGMALWSGVRPGTARAYFDGDACGGAWIPGCVPYAGAMVALEPGERQLSVFCQRIRTRDDPQRLREEAPASEQEASAAPAVGDPWRVRRYSTSARFESATGPAADPFCATWRY